jgi:hypothetical protein
MHVLIEPARAIVHTERRLWIVQIDLGAACSKHGSEVRAPVPPHVGVAESATHIAHAATITGVADAETNAPAASKAVAAEAIACYGGDAHAAPGECATGKRKISSNNKKTCKNNHRLTQHGYLFA